MPFDLASTHFYGLQLWMCVSRHLNLYKVKQIGTNILHDNLCPTWCLMCIMQRMTHVSPYSSLYKLKCLLVHTHPKLEGINVE